MGRTRLPQTVVIAVLKSELPTTNELVQRTSEASSFSLAYKTLKQVIKRLCMDGQVYDAVCR